MSAIIYLGSFILFLMIVSYLLYKLRVWQEEEAPENEKESIFYEPINLN